MEKEIWHSVKEFGNYEVSNLGRVKGLNRLSYADMGSRLLKEKVLKPAVNGSGYLRVRLYKNNIGSMKAVHKLVAVAFLGHEPCGMKLVINHINFNRLDNRVENLEIVTQRENANRKHLKSSSKYTGVSWNKKSNKWECSIKVNGQCKHMGYFKDELEASKAYENYRIENNIN